ncbi:MAG: ECF transporter S component [Clostridiales bacterium]|nr:ECF transporter S component [Candidatus Crickella merdequi]
MKWKLKDILMIAICGVLFAFVFMAANYIGVALTAALTPFGYAPLGYQLIYGLWFMAATFAAYIIQKKGVGTVAEMLAASIEMMMGGMFGPMTLVNGFIQGFGAELGFIATGYKKFNSATMILSSVTCALVSYVSEYFFYGYSAYSFQMNVIMIICRVISSIIFTAFVAKIIADGLAKAGVLRGYALGMKAAGIDEE